MKTGEVATMMGLNQKTIINWTDHPELSKYFSLSARRRAASDGVSESETENLSRSQREYLEPDILVINTIRIRKNRANSWVDVANLLYSGHRDTELPVTAALVKTVSAADQFTTNVTYRVERDAALAQLQDALVQIDDLKKQLEQMSERSRLEIEEVRLESHRQLADERDRTLRQLRDERDHMFTQMKASEAKLIGEMREMDRQIALLEDQLKRLQQT